MQGAPVLLGSVALRDKVGEIVATEKWTPDMMRYAEMTLRTTVLGGIGDQSRERLFRMCITVCLHRGLTPKELRMLPQWWHDAPAVDMAGGPIEIIWSKGIPNSPSAQPCTNPVRRPVDPRRPDLWLPLDCGQTRCAPCMARKVLRDQPARPSPL